MVQRDLRLSRKNARKIERALRQPRPCLLCGAFPPAYTGMFLPDRPELWGGQPNKTRVLAYALCARCYAPPDRNTHVEARIMAGVVGRAN